MIIPHERGTDILMIILCLTFHIKAGFLKISIYLRTGECWKLGF